MTSVEQFDSFSCQEFSAFFTGGVNHVFDSGGSVGVAVAVGVKGGSKRESRKAQREQLLNSSIRR